MVWIQRYLCPFCGHTVSLLPTFLAPHYQLTLFAVFWILRGIHRLHLPISAVALRWNRRLHAPVRLERQNIQYVQRRLHSNERLYRLFLNAGGSSPIGGLLLDSLPRFHGAEGLCLSFFQAWQRPFLATI